MSQREFPESPPCPFSAMIKIPAWELCQDADWRLRLGNPQRGAAAKLPVPAPAAGAAFERCHCRGHRRDRHILGWPEPALGSTTKPWGWPVLRPLQTLVIPVLGPLQTRDPRPGAPPNPGIPVLGRTPNSAPRVRRSPRCGHRQD